MLATKDLSPKNVSEPDAELPKSTFQWYRKKVWASIKPLSMSMNDTANFYIGFPFSFCTKPK